MDYYTPLEKIFRLNEEHLKALRRLGLETAGDLLFYFPNRWSDSAEIKTIGELAPGENASIYGTATNVKLSKGFRSKVAMAKAKITDATGEISAVWFHQPYVAKMLTDGISAKFTGKISKNKTGLYISNPEFERIDKAPDVGHSLFGIGESGSTLIPIYPETRGITSRWLYHSIQRLLGNGILDNLIDPIPEDILKKYNLPALKAALIFMHTPKKIGDAKAAEKRFAFEEIFMIQLRKQRDRQKNAESPAFVIEKTSDEIQKFTDRFPFEQTSAQKNATAAILGDFGHNHPMSRLLEGDVGSGKTAVAASAAYAAITTRPEGQKFGTLQVAYMCPTEILANQHFESFITYFFGTGISIALITGSGCKKFPSKINPNGWTNISRSQLGKWVANGEISIVVGTHALIQKSVVFKHLALVIIDEQHRFGTIQRQKLARKETRIPHLLSMTATPIPRSLALTLYGDLDLTLLDEMPAGRKRIITDIVPPTKRAETYEKVRAEIKAGRQAYVICPRINEPDPNKELALYAKSVKAEAIRLKKEVFQEFEIDILHGKMKPADKERVMNRFSAGEIDILVATSLVEVGINVPNATIILIEGAERFGLAQLHQLRGRVIRSSHQAYCFVFSDTSSTHSLERLKALKSASNGFELAEKDLVLRGAGELWGGKQWGVSDLAMTALKNIKMVEAARAEAQALVEKDPTLSQYPVLLKKIQEDTEEIHFE